MAQEELMRLVELLPPGRLKDDLVAGRLGALTTLTSQAVMTPLKLEPYLALSNDEMTVQGQPLSSTPSSEDISPEVQSLLAWAVELAEQDLVLPKPVSFLEAPLRRITIARVSDHAARYLRNLTSARIGQETGGWGMFNAQWHEERQREVLYALAALKEAMDARTARGGD